MNNYYEKMRENLKYYRIHYPLTQSELAEKSGISVRSITRFENGGDITLANFIKLMEALNLADNLLQLIPDQRRRPSAFLVNEKIKQRATSKRREEPKANFKWGDEE